MTDHCHCEVITIDRTRTGFYCATCGGEVPFDMTPTETKPTLTEILKPDDND